MHHIFVRSQEETRAAKDQGSQDPGGAQQAKMSWGELNISHHGSNRFPQAPLALTLGPTL
jgi:hypothetical protein